MQIEPCENDEHQLLMGRFVYLTKRLTGHSIFENDSEEDYEHVANREVFIKNLKDTYDSKNKGDKK